MEVLPIITFILLPFTYLLLHAASHNVTNIFFLEVKQILSLLELDHQQSAFAPSSYNCELCWAMKSPNSLTLQFFGYE